MGYLRKFPKKGYIVNPDSLVKTNIFRVLRYFLLLVLILRFLFKMAFTGEDEDLVKLKTKAMLHSVSLPQSIPYNYDDSVQAVVITTGYIDQCGAARLEHLVNTANSNKGNGPKREVWVLHNHDSLKPDDARLKLSQQFIANNPNLKSAQQNSALLFPFDTKWSGSSKSSFLRLMVEHNYTFAWLIEDDCFYTGRWVEFFDSANHDGADVVTAVGTYRAPKSKWWRKKPCFVDGESCSEIHPLIAGWQCVRVSLRFASSLLKEMQSGNASGNHETIVGAFSLMKEFRVKEVIGDRIGVVRFGNGRNHKTKNKKRLNLAAFKPIQPSRLYHPVKCEAYSTAPEEMQQLLEQWGTPGLDE